MGGRFLSEPQARMSCRRVLPTCAAECGEVVITAQAFEAVEHEGQAFAAVRRAFIADVEVEMRTGRVAGESELAEDLALADIAIGVASSAIAAALKDLRGRRAGPRSGWPSM